MALLLAASALFTTELMAQDLKKPTLEDLLSGGETYRIIESLPNLRVGQCNVRVPGLFYP